MNLIKYDPQYIWDVNKYEIKGWDIIGNTFHINYDFIVI